MTCVIIGSTGQLASAFAAITYPAQKAVFLGRSELDLAQKSQIYDRIAEIAPRVIINTAAYTAVDRAESDWNTAEAVNSESVKQLAKYASDHDALLIHFSTDYVFDGRFQGAYSETAVPNPLNIYGKTKLNGELAIKRSNCRHAIFRCSWVCGKSGNNFVRSILKLAKEQDELKIVDDQFGSPTSAEFIADSTIRFINKYELLTTEERAHLHGIYNVSSRGYVSWHGFATHIVTAAISLGFKSRCKPENIKPISTEDYGAVAPRPKNSRLDSSKLNENLKISPDTWQSQMRPVIKRVLEDLRNEP